MQNLIVVNNPEGLDFSDQGRRTRFGPVLPDRRDLQPDAPGAGVQPLQIIPLPEHRVLCFASCGGARPQATAQYIHHPGPEIPDARQDRRRRTRRAHSAEPDAHPVRLVRFKHLLREKHEQKVRSTRAAPVQSFSGAAPVRGVCPHEIGLAPRQYRSRFHR